MRIFKEKQRFAQLWLILLMAISALVPIGIILNQYFKDPKSMSVLSLTSTILIILVATCLIFLFNLTTRIDEQGIYYKFFPFHLKQKKIPWSAISKAYVRQYDALSEYGGWGLKGGRFWNKAKGTAINVSGDIGIQLELKNGKKLLIGTQKEKEASSTLSNYQLKITTDV